MKDYIMFLQIGDVLKNQVIDVLKLNGENSILNGDYMQTINNNYKQLALRQGVVIENRKSNDYYYTDEKYITVVENNEIISQFSLGKIYNFIYKPNNKPQYKISQQLFDKILQCILKYIDDVNLFKKWKNYSKFS